MEITGMVRISPPLNAAEVEYLTRFNATRRMARAQGPYFVDGTGLAGQDKGPDIIDHNSPPAEQPSVWCGWKPTEDGTGLVWDKKENFTYPLEWMAYLIEHFLTADAHAEGYSGPQRPEAFDHFTFDHTLSGRMEVTGPGRQRWQFIVNENVVEGVDLVGHGVPDLAEGDRWEIRLRAVSSREEFLAVVREYLHSPESKTNPWHLRSAARHRATSLRVPLDWQNIATELSTDAETDTDGLLDVLILVHGEHNAHTIWQQAMAELDRDREACDAQERLAASLSRLQAEITTAQDTVVALSGASLYDVNYAEGTHGEDLEVLLAEMSLRVRCAQALDRQVNPHHTT
ncbi:hypothetical protein ACWFMI_23895 [Nocardiopsis terrae]|uniref:hypothetical protein n=1 Tax=Streptomyces sp. NPDC057554 TaxID=3350538 RepID=UPI00367FFEF7